MTRIRLCAALVMVSFVLASVSTSFAQEKGKRRQGGFGFGGGSLLSSADVQKELKITDDQKKKIDEIQAAARPAGGTNFQDLSQEERRNLQEKAADARKKVEAVLTADQAKRYLELKFQQLNAIGNPEIQAALKMTDDQKEKLAQLAQEFGAKRRELGQDAGQEAREKLAKEQEEKSVALLTADQKSQLDKSKGAKADFALQPFSTFGGGRRGQNKSKTN